MSGAWSDYCFSKIKMDQNASSGTKQVSFTGPTYNSMNVEQSQNIKKNKEYPYVNEFQTQFN